jgi:hypothetical protein
MEDRMATEAFSPEDVRPGDNCAYARDRHANKMMWLNLWTILLFVLGAAVILLLVFALVLFFRQDLATGAISVAGSAVSGLGARWVVGQRTVAKEEEEAADRSARRECNDQPASGGTRNVRIRPFGLG